jgi:hypothetical protein
MESAKSEEIINPEENSECGKSQKISQKAWDIWNEPDSNTENEKSDIRKDLELSKRFSEISKEIHNSGEKRWEDDTYLECSQDCQLSHQKDSIFSFKNEIENAFNLDLPKPYQDTYVALPIFLKRFSQ